MTNDEWVARIEKNNKWCGNTQCPHSLECDKMLNKSDEDAQTVCMKLYNKYSKKSMIEEILK
jgi:hypothetical protein